MDATTVTAAGADAGSALVERDLLVQRTLFSGPRRWVNDDLYSRIVRGVVRRTRAELHLDAGAVVDTNTYFGRFEASYWQRWTSVTSLTVRVAVESEGRLDVLVRASDIGAHVRTVDVFHHQGDGMAVLHVPVDTFVDGGAMWLEFHAVDAAATVSEVTWSATTTSPARRAAVAICTFNRADDCAATVDSLASDPLVAELIDDLYVTDQGTDLVETREAFRHAAGEFGDRLHYLRQPNLGGAGGFSRGMFEATAPGSPGPVDVLLMDDDVRVEPETVLRLFAFAAVTREPMLVGAQMLYLFNPDYLLVSAERTQLDQLKGGLDADEFALRDESVVDHRQERRIDAEYNAWWSCLVPGEAVERVGLPMPYFFQWDDIEYGLRCRQAGMPTCTLQGAAVWHADFYWKDGDDFGQFFSQRNSLASAAIRQGIDPRAMAKNLGRSVLRALVGMQYGLAATRMRGIEAFLDGPEGPHGVGDGGQAALAAIRAERAGYPETAKLAVDALPAGIKVERKVGIPREDREDQVLAKRLLVQKLGRQRRGVVAIPYEDAAWWHVSLFDEVYVTDASQTGVHHRKVDPRRAAELQKRLGSLMARFVREAPEAQERWRAAQARLTTRENWARLYGE
ncbi:glycosyltransferase [Dietzia psychralcaliphila]|uniref:Glycosyl transferase n=1 Tax=Dietzia psychralcaliphila TaxID=139021 RepID=A0AAD0JP74_9ACTN|nr:glycosyltransferase [Dietzia psychralcaliphila]AWH94419.1 glycosyl transferase [Dietzia psychralcaliphila]PTM88055.1 galactofuranosylgalactofuranosylrhamnosyl-N-acetylglucosaminyl-diphospho-decaprenol beta-1,5/1,6-galactofuranosyltransferase [Dietzia psychralcaliphila]